MPNAQPYTRKDLELFRRDLQGSGLELNVAPPLLSSRFLDTLDLRDKEIGRLRDVLQEGAGLAAKLEGVYCGPLEHDGACSKSPECEDYPETCACDDGVTGDLRSLKDAWREWAARSESALGERP